MFESIGQLPGNWAGKDREALEKCPTLHHRFPGLSGSEPMAVYRGNSDAMAGLLPDGLIHPGSQVVFIKRPEPRIMVSRKDRETSSSFSEVHERLKARASERMIVALSTRKPEVAEVSDNRQGVLRREPLDKGSEAIRPFSAVEPEVDVTHEVISHGIDQSCQASNVS